MAGAREGYSGAGSPPRRAAAAAAAPPPPPLGTDYPANNVTWRELAALGREKAAKGKVLRGDVAHRQDKYWPNSRQVKVRDAEGIARAVFFYPQELDPPQDYDDIQPGGIITLKSPRLHRFMDGQDGLRIEEADKVLSIEKRPLTDHLRLEYAGCAKELGNTFFKAQPPKLEDAVDQYRVALDFVDAATGASGADRSALRAACHLNTAACAHGLKKFSAVEGACLSALAADPKSAKAHFRIGQAAVEMGDWAKAVKAFTAAQRLAPTDKKVAQELARAQQGAADAKGREKKMWAGVLSGEKG